MAAEEEFGARVGEDSQCIHIRRVRLQDGSRLLARLLQLSAVSINRRKPHSGFVIRRVELNGALQVAQRRAELPGFVEGHPEVFVGHSMSIVELDNVEKLNDGFAMLAFRHVFFTALDVVVRSLPPSNRPSSSSRTVASASLACSTSPTRTCIWASRKCADACCGSSTRW